MNRLCLFIFCSEKKSGVLNHWGAKKQNETYKQSKHRIGACIKCTRYKPECYQIFKKYIYEIIKISMYNYRSGSKRYKH